MTAPHLLAANALIALTVTEHEHHQRAAHWLSTGQRIALCPVVEGALTRFLVRLGQTPATASMLLDALYEQPRCEFWPDDLSYRHANMGHVVGHRQVTDAYLVALATHHGGRLATFDQPLAQALPDQVVLIP